MNRSPVAVRYARAIFELGVESGDLSPLIEQLRQVSECLEEHAELRGLFSNPLVDPSDQQKVAEALAVRLGLSGLAQKTLRLLSTRRRMGELAAIMRELVSLSDQRAGVIRAKITSATPLLPEQTTQLRGELERLTGKRVLVDQEVDPSLLGGWIARVADHVVDTSVRGRLDELERRLFDLPNA